MVVTVDSSSNSTLRDEAELHLHEEEAPRHRARRHGEAAGGGGGAGATSEADTTTNKGENSAGAAAHHHHVPRQLVRQAGHRVPVPEPSRSFWYVLCAPAAHTLARSFVLAKPLE